VLVGVADSEALELLMQETIIALNAGSSSIKASIFGCSPKTPRLWQTQVDGIGWSPTVSLTDADGRKAGGVPTAPSAAADHAEVMSFVLEEIIAPRAGRPVGVGHRVVHGGPRYSRPNRVDDGVLEVLAGLTSLARSHQPHNLAGIRAASAVWPELPQVACYDTAFHRTLAEAEQVFAIPKALTESGIRRYGFHGLSYEWIAAELPQHLGALADGKVVVAHLGNGASLTGMTGRRSRYTTMGFTPLDGLVMGRRPGRLDPGVILHLLSERGMPVEELVKLLNRDCGLMGISGLSPDMRDLLASQQDGARLAVEVFVARLVGEIGAAAAAIEGLDAIVFTGGIGENAAPVRARTVERLAWLGAEIDPESNAEGALNIGSASSRVRLLVMPTDEERMIARHVHGFL
jgi:acetate kinase